MLELRVMSKTIRLTQWNAKQKKCASSQPWSDVLSGPDIIYWGGFSFSNLFLETPKQIQKFLSSKLSIEILYCKVANISITVLKRVGEHDGKDANV